MLPMKCIPLVPTCGLILDETKKIQTGKDLSQMQEEEANCT